MLEALVIVGLPFYLYFVVRLLVAAATRSYFETKKECHKEEK
jgi:hypothetical protein